MNDDGTPIEAGAAGAPEGAPPTEPTTDEVGKMYDELGIKAPKPTGKTKGRPKASTVRAKDVSDDDDGDSESGRQKDQQSKGKSKAASDSDKDGDSGDDSDSKGSKKRSDSGEVSDEPEETDGGVRSSKSKADRDSEQGGEEDADGGDSGAGQDEDESDDSSEEGKDAEGKRPGKSNPEIERRFQRLTEEKRARDERIAELERKLQETSQQHQQAQIAQEDPEYTVEDFLKVRDDEGNVIDLDPEQAELAWRRWKDGFEQRKSEREAQWQREQQLERQQQETTQRLMQSSVEAYDTLTGLLDEYPELNKNSPEFDQDFSDSVLPIIEDAILYAPGTEPGNEDNAQPVIVGFRMNPKRILEGMGRIKSAKRSLPLNGINDNVEVRSNVNVPHSRSSDPTLQAANDLYKELGINKRV